MPDEMPTAGGGGSAEIGDTGTVVAPVPLEPVEPAGQDSGSWGPTMSVSEPEEIVHHPIIQQDIETALNASDSKTHSVAFGFIFGGISLLQNVLNTFVAYKTGGTPAVQDVILTAVCVACLGVGVAKYSQYRQEKKPADELRNRLRARKKVTIARARMS